MLKLLTIINKMLISAAETLYKQDEESYVETIFDLFAKECPSPSENKLLTNTGKYLYNNIWMLFRE